MGEVGRYSEPPLRRVNWNAAAIVRGQPQKRHPPPMRLAFLALPEVFLLFISLPEPNPTFPWKGRAHPLALSWSQGAPEVEPD